MKEVTDKFYKVRAQLPKLLCQKNQSRPNRGLEDLIEVSSHGAFQRLLLPFCTVEGEITGRLKLNQPSF